MPKAKIISPRQAVIAVVLSLIAAVLLLFSLLTYAFWQDECRHNPALKQLALALRIYSDESDAIYEYAPQLSSTPGKLMFDPDGLYPEFIREPRMLFSLADPIAREASRSNEAPEYYFDHSSYLYLGYMVWDDATVAAFAEAYREHIQQGLPFDTDLPANPPVTVLKRIDYSVYRQMITEDQIDNPEWEYLTRISHQSAALAAGDW